MIKEEVKVLMADNLGAHISTRVMELCTEYNIRWVGTYLTGTVPVPTKVSLMVFFSHVEVTNILCVHV